MITDRDMEVFKFINLFGYSFIPVLGKTFWNSEITARARLRKLTDSKLLKKKQTGMITPRYAFFLGAETISFIEDNLGLKALKNDVKISTINHLMIEQLTYFYLARLGTVERTTVVKHNAVLNHIPDMIYRDEQDRKFYIEVEYTKKTTKRYDEIFNKTIKDNPHAIVYVLEDSSKIKSFASAMPISSKLFYIGIDELIENIKSTGKISPIPQQRALNL